MYKFQSFGLIHVRALPQLPSGRRHLRSDGLQMNAEYAPKYLKIFFDQREVNYLIFIIPFLVPIQALPSLSKAMAVTKLLVS